MAKVEIDFPADMSDNIGVIQLGRLLIGDSVCRLYFAPDGKMHMYCNHGAKNFIHFQHPLGDEPIIYGFNSKKD